MPLQWPLLSKGDTVLVHSSIRRTLRCENCSPVDVLESLLDTVGPRGTLMLPLFNFDFCRGTPFDIRSTPSQMGALTEAARKYPGAVRTYNPIYGFAIIGLYQGMFLEYDNHDCLGNNSPFGKLREMDAKIAVIDLPDSQSMTYYHHIEQMCGAENRYLKNFPGNCTNWYGETFMRFYTCFVRREGNETHVGPMETLLWQDGYYIGNKPMQGDGMRVIRAREIFDVTKTIIDKGSEGLLWRKKDAKEEVQGHQEHNAA